MHENIIDVKGCGAARECRFPVISAFVMAIIKPRGHSLKELGVYFVQSVCARGQIYCGLTRGRSRQGVGIYVKSSFVR
jgi:hypothetical protein